LPSTAPPSHRRRPAFRAAATSDDWSSDCLGPGDLAERPQDVRGRRAARRCASPG
jgi:hypothetical protein